MKRKSFIKEPRTDKGNHDRITGRNPSKKKVNEVRGSIAPLIRSGVWVYIFAYGD